MNVNANPASPSAPGVLPSDVAVEQEARRAKRSAARDKASATRRKHAWAESVEYRRSRFEVVYQAIGGDNYLSSYPTEGAPAFTLDQVIDYHTSPDYWAACEEDGAFSAGLLDLVVWRDGRVCAVPQRNGEKFDVTRF